MQELEARRHTLLINEQHKTIPEGDLDSGWWLPGRST